jgi:hypothetical protein
MKCNVEGGVYLQKGNKRLRSQLILSDKPTMRNNSLGTWHVKKHGGTFSILRQDSSVVAVLPQNTGSADPRFQEVYVIAAAPQLLEACTQLKSILENNLIVTSDGFRINCSEARETLLGAILRATGCRRSSGEP